MKRFYYKAIKDQKELVSGYVEADDYNDAKEKVRIMGFTPTGIYEENINRQRRVISKDRPVLKIGTNNLKLFSSELSMFLDSGISVFEALESIQKHAHNVKISLFANNLLKSMKEGATFSEALLPHEKYLGNIYISICKTGEESGALPASLKYLTELLKRKIELRNQFIRISIYPAILLTMLVFLYFFFGCYVFPTIIERMGIDYVPPLAEFFIKGSLFVKNTGLIFVLIIAGVVALINFTCGFVGIKNKIADFMAKIPLLKSCILYFSLSHYMLSLYIAYKSGVPISEALSLAEQTIPTKTLRSNAKMVTESVKKGNSLTSAFGNSEILPPVMMSMISTGEQTGKLEKMFLDISNAVSKKLNDAIEVLAQTFPVIMLLFVGGGVGIAAIAVLQMYAASLSAAF